MPSSADLAAWVGAVGTWAALGAAVYGARAAFHMIRVERDRDREQERQRQADQASSVAAWVGREESSRPVVWQVIPSGSVSCVGV
jgi:hypothetical protein